MLASSLLGGMVAGQILGGALGDSCLGLTGALALVMVLQLVASIGSAVVSVHHAHEEFYYTLATWRFILGIGAGAVYPLAACLSVEQGTSSSCKDHEALRLQRVVWTFCMQGVGFWVVPALATALVYCPPVRLDLIWRILLGAGCLPGVVLLYLQYRVLVYPPSSAPSATTSGSVSPVTTADDDNHNNNNNIDEEPVIVVDSAMMAAAMEDNNDNNNKNTDRRDKNSSNSENNPPSLPLEQPPTVETLPPESPHSAPDLQAFGSQDTSGRQISQRTEHDRQREQENTGMTDRELHDDSDGEVGTFLDSSPDMDMSSAGIYRESEPPAITTGWWVSLQTEERLCQKLMGTAVTWFLFDVLFYGNTLFQPIVIEQAFGSRKTLAPEALIRRVVTDSLVLNSIALPGYFVAALLIGKKTFGIKQSPRCKSKKAFFDTV